MQNTAYNASTPTGSPMDSITLANPLYFVESLLGTVAGMLF